MALKKQGDCWWADYYDSTGKRVRRNLGKSKRIAEEQYTRLKEQIREEKLFGAKAPERILLSDFIDEYLEWYRSTMSETTTRTTLHIFKEFQNFFPNRNLHDIKPKDLERYRAHLKDRLKISTLNMRMTRIKAIFNRAMDWEYLHQNPFDKVKPLKSDQPTFRLLTDSEVVIILMEAQKLDQDLYYALHLGLYAGLRLGEILNLRWEDLDFRNSVIKVESREGRSTKTRQSRVVPMTNYLKEVLRKKPREIHGGLVLQKKNQDIQRQVTKLQKKINKEVEHWSFHDTRHYFASSLVMRGADLVAVSKLLGHSDITMTMRYSHVSPDHLKSTVELLDGHFLDKVERQE